MTTGLAAGDDISFGATLTGTAASAQTLGLTAGAGDITFTGAVGGLPLGGIRLGEVTVTSGATVLASSTFTAASFTQLAGTVATTFTGLVDLTSQFDFTGNNLTMNGVGSNVVGTTMDVANAGLFTTANGANLSVGNEFKQDGAGLNSIGGNIASTNDGIAFATGVTLTNSVLMTTGLAAGDDISFGSTINGDHNLTVTAGVVDPVTFASTGGDVYFRNSVGSIEALRSLTVTSADSSTHFFADVTTVGDQLYTGGASIDGNAIFTATDTLANITFNGAINNGAFVPSNMTVDAGGNVIFNGNIGSAVNGQLGTFTVDSGNDLGETITFGEFGSGFFDQAQLFEVWAQSVQLNTGATSTLAAPATIATIASQSDVGITFNTDDFAMGQNQKLTSFGGISINSLINLNSNATSVTLGDVNAIGNLVVNSDLINLLGRASGPILTNTGGTVTDLTVDIVVSGQVFFSTSPVMSGTNPSGAAVFSNSTGNVDGSGTLNSFAKTVYPSEITASLLSDGSVVLDLFASGSSYENPANFIAPPMSILPPVGLFRSSDEGNEEEKKNSEGKSDGGTGKAASTDSNQTKSVPVASR